MKKFVTIFLALAMILALTIPAFATDKTNLTITSTDRTYEGYKLLNLSTGLKPSHTAHDGDCTDTCYNYSYTVNEKYKDILKEVLDVNNDDAILAKLATLTSDNGVADYGTLRPVADAIYRAIKKANLDPDANQGKVFNGTANIEQGYWLFADVTNLEGEEEANSLVIVDTAGLAGVTITPKTALPTVEKKVLDDEATTPNWQDSADYDINDDVPFKLKGTLPANLSSYKTYSITFHDTLSAGLTYNEDAKVMIGNVDVTDKFDINHENGALTIECENVLAINGVNANTLFEVFYTAELNENAALGAVGNPNKVYMEYSTDPYSDSTGVTEEDVVKVFTYELIINKIDGVTQDPLTGASFKLSKKEADGTYTLISEITSTAAAPLSSFLWKGLDAGEYQLEETVAPDGYNKLDNVIDITITAAHDINSADPQLTELTSTKGVADVNAGTITETIKNNTGTVLPDTGAKGTMWLIGGGAILVAFASVFMITRKKMSVFED